MRHQSPSSWAVICVCIAAVVHFALGFSIEFSVDEAHYALYAQHLAWSYFDHPPLVGWIQWPLVTLTSSEGLIRLIPELLWILSCYLVYQVTLEVHHLIQGRNAGYLTSALPSPNTCGLMAVLAVIAAPIPHVLAIGLLPDTLLIPLSLGLMWMALRWLIKDHFTLADWVLTGVLLGLAGLSKYTAAFTAIALLFVFISAPRKVWISQAGFWFAALIALAFITPVLYWNYVNDWISFKYQIAHGAGSSWLWRRLAAYIGVQILVYGPLLVLGAFLFLKNCLQTTKLALLSLLGFFVIPFAIFTGLSGGGGLPHWTSPAWFCLAPFAGIGLAKAWTAQQHRLIRFLFIFQLALCFIGFGFVLSGGINSDLVKSNPIADLYGWKLAGEKAAQLSKANKASGIAVQNWTLGSRAAWYARPTPVFVLDDRQDQFDLWFGKLPKGANILLVNWSGMSFSPPIRSKNGFEHCAPLESLEIKRLGQSLSTFDFSLCSNWQD
ncbi:glycosyltransferase family 39 protein [Polynucleobacter asymbioticus]|uniref:4-amino-4-deoxy-L-arabinose transferase and related glycosyltransferase of PMT family-like protein n=1 Tax=Polynucleobacter asymbioticus (strain DSM 18221 / CIP 109841 / QLW-P1DMWA-1) TaxID=312153 RepID=A4SYQ9_POLAQ|nr:glycosyltransferase family 39 protein [Polynucleobacter asymbioticus]ABP34623.1 4-amino-4-deoxy-L-arabinose transferase and related glycosyltransferase of PMT family-like protein [Polynucleobacter asymbioticus QLW-P1DMWA-1]APC06464.1 glycosyl transferase [Polynucleobacter asymbioticus]